MISAEIESLERGPQTHVHIAKFNRNLPGTPSGRFVALPLTTVAAACRKSKGHNTRSTGLAGAAAG